MATKLKTFDFTAPSAITNPSEKAVYPWEEWLDGDIWRLEQDEDFDTHPLMMERIIRTRATARGAKVRLRHQALNGDGPFGIIIVQRSDVDGPAAAKKAAQAQARAEKKAQADKEAAELLAKAGIKPTKKAAAKPAKPAARNGKATAAPVKRAVSKRPAKRVSVTA